MERKIGETFELEGTTLRVTETKEHTCNGCYLRGECYREKREVTGECFDRVDKKNVIFTEATETSEQPALQEAQKLNLLEILKNCPRNTLLWSPMSGDVKFKNIENEMIVVYQEQKNVYVSFFPDGTKQWGYAGFRTLECMLFPSKEQRDWSKVRFETPVEKLPKSWEEFCETHEVQKGEAYIKDISNIYVAGNTGDTRDMNADKNILPSEQACHQHLALMQLHQLRDAWRQGWLPDWKDDNQSKYAICSLDGEFSIRIRYTNRHFLAFQDEKRADEFKDCFIDLIRKAGDLI